MPDPNEHRETVRTDDDAALRTVTTGAPDGPPVLLCHGGPGMWDYLEPVAQLLPRHRTHRFHQRNCGWSTGPEDYSVSRAVADVEALRQHWGYGTWSVFGHSWGATLALAYAWTHPEHVERVVFCCGLGPGEEWKFDYRAEEARRLTPEQLARRRQLRDRERTADEEVEYLTLCWCTDHADPVQGMEMARRDALTARYEVNVRANRELQAEASSWSVPQIAVWAASITAPVLVVHGQCDPRPLWSIERIRSVVPDGRLAIIAGAGHEPWREDPDALTALLTGFLSQPVPEELVDSAE